MYYYIIDPPKGLQTAKIAQRLQELVTPMGISGEISIATPARSAEELTYMGIDKGYTTLIAVGGEELANTVATILMNESREKIAFGIIPLNAGYLIPSMIGVANNDIRMGVEVIKQRHLDLVDLVQIGTKRFMFTEAVIAAARKVKMILEIDQLYKVELEADYLHLSNDLILTVQAADPQTMFKKTLSLIGLNASAESISSQFHGKQMRLVAHEPVPVLVAGQVVAKTPTTFTRVQGALKLITPRAILPQKTINDFPQKPTTRTIEDQSARISYDTHKELYSRTQDQ
jgi:diacylglycerol kinase family enzyme